MWSSLVHLIQHNKKYNLTGRLSSMCGLTAHAVQLHELWSISSGQKTTCKKKSTYKTIDWKVSSVSSVFGVSSVFIGVRSWRDPERSHSSSVREVIPLSPSQPAPVISALYRCKWFHRPTDRQRRHFHKPSPVGEGAPQHPKDTTGSTLAPIPPDPFSHFKK